MAASGGMAEVQTRKAEQLIEDAEKRMKSFWPLGKQGKIEDAADLYGKAAAQYKMAKSYDDAGAAYKRAAELSEQANNAHDANKYYRDAAKVYKKENPDEAIILLEMLARRSMENNRFSQAAKIFKEMAELHESQMRINDAAKCYNDAADCFQNEDAGTSANQCLLKVADYSAQQDEFKRAIEILEKVASASLDNNLTKWSVTGYLFKAAICHLRLAANANVYNDVQSTLDRYKDMHAQFDGSRECKLLENLISTFDENDVEQFTDYLFEYDQISKLDNWHSSQLLALKNKMKENAEKIDEIIDFT